MIKFTIDNILSCIRIKYWLRRPLSRSERSTTDPREPGGLAEPEGAGRRQTNKVVGSAQARKVERVYGNSYLNINLKNLLPTIKKITIATLRGRNG